MVIFATRHLNRTASPPSSQLFISTIFNIIIMMFHDVGEGGVISPHYHEDDECDIVMTSHPYHHPGILTPQYHHQ